MIWWILGAVTVVVWLLIIGVCRAAAIKQDMQALRLNSGDYWVPLHPVYDRTIWGATVPPHAEWVR